MVYTPRDTRRLFTGAHAAESATTADLWVPGAERLPLPKSAGISYLTGVPWRFVFHTIEGRPSVQDFRALAARHVNPPHLWAMPSADLLLQVIPLNRAAYALAHPKGRHGLARVRRRLRPPARPGELALGSRQAEPDRHSGPCRLRPRRRRPGGGGVGRGDPSLGSRRSRPGR